MARCNISKLVGFLLLFQICNCEESDDLEYIESLSKKQKRQLNNNWQWAGSSPWGAPKPPKSPQPLPTPPSPVQDGTQTNLQTKCDQQRFDGIYYYGKVNSVSKNVDNPDTCVAMCWQMRKKGARCASVNHLKKQNKCEILDDQLNTKKTYLMNLKTEKNPNAVYAIPINCTEPTPEPAQKAETLSFVQRDSSPPGSCGYTFEEPKFSELISTRSRSSLRIIGGFEARPHSFPWLVSLQEMGDHFCGGALIRVSPNKEESDIILTAAHCLFDKPSSLKVLIGAHNIRKEADGQIKLPSEAYIWHENYDKETVVNDVGLIKLKEPVKFSRTIQPACLPDHGEKVLEGQTAVVAGWGSMHESYVRMPDALMQVPVKTLNYETCATKYYPGEMFAPEMFCAGHVEGGRDSCQGDSGGPLIFKTAKGWMTRGVVSFGEGCARAGKPGVYANLSNYIPWIKEHIAQLTSIKA